MKNLIWLLGLICCIYGVDSLVGQPCKCAGPPPPQGPICPPTPRCPPCHVHCPARRWQRVTPSMVLGKVQERTILTLSRDDQGGLVIKGRSTTFGCGSPGSGSLVYILGNWVQIRYTQEFRGSASCWKIFGVTAYQKNKKPFAFGGNNTLTNGVEDLDVSQGDGIFNQFRMNSRNVDNFDGKVYRCDNTNTNFWHTLQRSRVRRATVMLRRSVHGGNAGISTETSCGLASYTITDIWVLV